MGDGICTKCTNCGYEFDAYFGVGMLFPFVYQETIVKAKTGELGEVTKEFIEKYPDGAFDCENVVIKCDNCNMYDVALDSSMHVLKDKLFKPSKYNWTYSGETDGTAYVTDEQLKDHYEKIADYSHKCKYCGGKARINKSFEQDVYKNRINCPKCNGLMTSDEVFDWD